MPAMNTQDDIAIIGLACRFPGDASSSQRFYDMLSRSKSAWSEIPPDRFNVEAYHHPSYDRQGTIVSKGGYFLKEDISKWDAPFFSMTAAEANAMDPQHRLLLEVAFESFENAGLPINELAGTETGCYVGAFTKDYEQICTRDLGDKLLYTGTGNGPTMLANRVSWFYDLRGPSVSLDTACSSSLVAIHLACEAIRSDRSNCRTAIAGGVSLILAPDIFTSLSAMHFLSPDSKSYSFDARANGYARGEGCSFLVLKHIDDAIRDGDTIRAVIRGTGTNQDGKTPGISLPSAEAQASLIESTYNLAGLPYTDTGFFEAHGTGTAAGDPLEASSIGATFGKDTTRSEPLWVGSLKSNFGHLEGCAGIAGVLKGVLSLESGYILPQHDFQSPNPRIRMQDWNIRIPTELIPWPSQRLRRMSVNSFGYGGSNAHAIIDDAYHYLKDRGLVANHNTICRAQNDFLVISDDDDSALGTMSTNSDAHGSECSDSLVQHDRPRLFTMSAPEQAALVRMATQYCDFLSMSSKSNTSYDDKMLRDLAYTLSMRRSTFQWRAVAIASNSKELAEIFPEAAKKPLRSSKPPRMVWIFNGQGAQWARMGAELMDHSTFSASVTAADEYLKSLGAKWSVITEMLAPSQESRINSPRFSQPICAIIQVAIVDLLKYWGLQPQAVIGHSSGEIGAAYALGAVSAQDAWKIAYHRGRLSEEINLLAPSQHGAMMSVGLSEDEVQSYLDKVSSAGTVVVACMNSPSNVTLSGDYHVLSELESTFQSEQIFARMLKVENAYHSPHMKVIADQYLEALADVSTKVSNGKIKMFSSVTGLPVQASDLGAAYWVQNMVQPVQFVKALDHTFETVAGERRKRKDALRIDCAVEIGPHSALRGPLMQFLSARNKRENTSYYSVLSRGKNASATALESVGSLWCLGAPLNLQKVNEHTPDSQRPKVLVDLPAYPWNHTNSYWHESSQSKNHRFRKFARLDYLGAPVEDFNPHAALWKNVLRASEVPWILDHKIQSDIIFPGAGMICTALQAARQLADPSKRVRAFEFRDITIGRALVIPSDDSGVEIFMQIKSRKMGMKSATSSWHEFTFYSLDRDGTHNEHSSGLFQILYETGEAEADTAQESLAEEKAYQVHYNSSLVECTQSVDRDALYNNMRNAGLNYGPTFQGMTSIKIGSMVACTEITIPDTQSVMPSQCESDHIIHPATLDAFFQSSFPAYVLSGNIKEPGVPTGIGYLWISATPPQGAGGKFCGVTKVAKRGFREMTASIAMMDPVQNKPAVIIKDYVATSVGSQSTQLESADPTEMLRTKICSKVIYRPDIDLTEASRAQEILGQDVVDSTHLRDWARDREKASAIYIRRLMDSIPQDLVTSLEGDNKRLYEWMQNKTSASNMNILSQQSTKDVELDSSQDSEQFFLQVFDESYGADAELLKEVTNNLLSVLEGSRSNLDVLREYMSSSNYQDSQMWQCRKRTLQKWFDLAGHKNPDMKILEFGVDIESVALPILETIGGQDGSNARCSSYILTDASSAVIDKVQQQLHDWSGIVECKRLDATLDLQDQGLDPDSVDVVIVHSSVSVTTDVASALSTCAKLLKTNGKLVLEGILVPNDYACLAYQGLAIWSSSLPESSNSPLMSLQQWSDKLAEAGFSGAELIVHDTSEEGSRSTSMIVSTKPPSTPLPSEEIVILYQTDSSRQTSLARIVSDQLSSCGYDVTLLSLSEAAAQRDDKIQASGKCVLSLLETDQILLADIGKKEFDEFKSIILQASRVLWVTCTSPTQAVIDPHLRTVSGLFRGISADDESMHLHELHLHHDLERDVAGASSLVFRSLSSIFEAGDNIGESDMIEQNGQLCIPRYYDEEHANHRLATIEGNLQPELQPLLQTGRPLKLTISSPGMLDTLHFVDDPIQSTSLADDHVEVEVKASGMNFVDIMVAMGQVPDTKLGMDAAGIVTKVGCNATRLQVGDRVAVVATGAFSTVLRVPHGLAQKLPDDVTFEEGCTIPVVWLTAYHSLVQVAHLQKGEAVLIHAAAGGLGLALIQLAHHIGAEVYATVGTDAKRELIVAMGVREDHIFNSRNLSFAQGIRRMTHGKGVDVVVNSLAGEALRKTWECIADFGRFIEVGKKDILNNTGLEMMPFLKNVTFAGVNLEHILRNYVPKMSILFEQVMDLFHQGVAKVARPITVHDWSDLETCFRTMQQGRHIGKLVMRMTSESKVPVIPRNPHPLDLKKDASYVLVGGLGGLGRGQAIRLAERGARHIAFLSRSGAAKPEAKKTIEQLESMGVKVRAYSCDITDKTSLSQALSRIPQDLAPIRGVIQSAMVLADGVFENMSYEKWLAATRPKIQGTWNLHELIPKDLDFFVVLSSVVGITGGRTQPNYAAGNTFQDAFATYRRSLGLPIQTVNLGIITGLGYVEENKDSAELAWVNAMEMITIKPPQFYSMFESAMTGYSHSENKLPPQITMGAGSGGLDMANQAAGSPYQIPWLYRFAHFAYLRKLDLRGIAATDSTDAANELKALLANASSTAQAAEVVQDAITSKLAKAMMIAAADIDPTKPLHHYGVDSLVAVEVRNWIFRELKSDVSIFDILASTPISQLAVKIVGKCKLVSAEVRGDGEV